jgi:lipopolysaccharide export system permease protein
MLITLFHGTQYEELKEDETTKVENRQYPYHLDIFEKQVMIIPLKGFDFKENDASLFRQNYNMLNVSQLRDKIDSLNEKYLSKIDYYFRILMNNDLLKNQIKFRTNTDSVNYLSQIEELNKVNSKNLTVFYNIDSAFVNQTIHNQKEVLKISQNNAENLLNRLVVFNAEFTSRRSWLIEHQVAMHKKYVLAVACFIFFFIGAPLGSIIRKGGIGLPTIISVLLFIIFYVILTFGEKLARDGHLTALIGIWLAVIIYFPFVFYLFYVASTDSVLFNFDTYKDFFDKIKQKLTIRIKFRIKYLAKKNKNKNKINDEQR